VAAVGPDFEELGISWLGEGEQRHRYAAIGSDKNRRYGFQYHPEVDDTEFGDRMLANFVLEICGCRPSWTMEGYIEEQMARIKAQVGDDAVFLLASGGVDSTVAAILLGRALGEGRLNLLHVDNGLMRKDESREVLGLFKRMGLDSNLHFIDASADFLAALAGVTEPEQKRAIIGNTFVEVFQREASRLGIADHLLGQGTIYPDTIETGGTRRADTIKTHHNRVPIIEEMIAAGKVIEPLADLYKVEVRELGERLGVPHDLVWRHPFPGPGLGVRLLCSDGSVNEAELAEPRRQARSLAAGFGLEAEILPIRSVGVKADLRCYEHPVLLNGAVDFETLLEAAGTILRQTEGVNRCLWNLAEAMPQSMRLLPATVTRERLDLLREADHLVMDGLRRHGLYEEIWQCPTVLVPLSLDERGRETVIVRPIYSERAMTASPARLTSALLDELRQRILDLPGVAGLMLDVTTKPPATIEWE
jgi:GMP synthase (glutamine-hydrolysing)